VLAGTEVFVWAAAISAAGISMSTSISGVSKYFAPVLSAPITAALVFCVSKMLSVSPWAVLCSGCTGVFLATSVLEHTQNLRQMYE